MTDWDAEERKAAARTAAMPATIDQLPGDADPDKYAEVVGWRDENGRAKVHGDLDAIAWLVGPRPDPPPAHGPQPITSRAEVEETRRTLDREGEPNGERAIAKRLGVSRDAVRWALGKDRK